MEWISVKDKFPDYERYAIVWHTGLQLSQNCFYNGQDKWVNFNTPGYELQYYSPEQITHWMYWPEQPEELNGK
jgi:hypothetical protein